MTLKISKRSIPYFLSILILFGSCYFTSLWSATIIPGMGKRVSLTLFATLILSWMSLSRHGKGLPMTANVLLITMISIVIYGWITVRDPATEGYVSIITVYFIMMIIMRDERWLSYFWNLSICAAFFYIITTIWLSADTNSVFKLFATNLYPNENRFTFWISQGFCFGVTDHYSTNGMALANASIVIGTMTIVGGKKKRYSIALLLSVVALFLTGKRAHLLFTFISLVLSIYIYRYYEKQRDLKFAILFIGMLIAVSFAYCFIPQVQDVLSRFGNTSTDENMLLRFSFWRAAIEAFSEKPLLGVGWFGFRNSVAPTVGYTGHCHNVYIQLLCETGILGTSIFMAWFVYSLCLSVRFALYVARNKKTIQNGYQILSIYSIAYQIYFLLYCLTGNPLYDAYAYPMYMVACTIGIYYHNKRESLINACEKNSWRMA